MTDPSGQDKPNLEEIARDAAGKLVDDCCETDEAIILTALQTVRRDTLEEPTERIAELENALLKLRIAADGMGLKLTGAKRDEWYVACWAATDALKSSDLPAEILEKYPWLKRSGT